MRRLPAVLTALGVILIAIAVFSPLLLIFLRQIGIFSGPWGGFGPFVISLYLQPWIGGCGVLLLLIGFALRKRDAFVSGKS
jgi:hypothetical protein